MKRFAFLWVVMSLAWGAGAAWAAPLGWDLNDVSFLFALPSAQEEANVLLGPESSGAQGQLLPWRDFQRVPTLLNNGNGNATLFRGALRVVAVRFDPCPEEPACAPELRLVWQPVERPEGELSWTTRDGAAHSFYALSADEAVRLRERLWSLKLLAWKGGADTSGVPLGVHPALQKAELSAWFRAQLEATLLDFCGEKNLKKITFMSLLVPSTWWRFGSFEKNAAGAWVEGAIPRLTMKLEDVFNSAMEESTVDVPGREMDAVLNVLPEAYPEEDNLLPLVNKGFRNNDASDRAVFQDKLDAVARFRNPHRTSARNLDCASCHMAEPAAFFAGLRFPELKAYFSPESYRNPEEGVLNLANTSMARSATRVLRAFGYFKNEPAFNQRVIHDSAETAHWLNRR